MSDFELEGPQPDGATHEVHGVRLIRTGSCNQCGLCGCGECPHVKIQGKKYVCTIYDTRDQYCEECGTTHQYCIDFPEHPWGWMIRSGECGYHFMICATPENIQKLQKLNTAWPDNVVVNS